MLLMRCRFVLCYAGKRLRLEATTAGLTANEDIAVVMEAGMAAADVATKAAAGITEATPSITEAIPGITEAIPGIREATTGIAEATLIVTGTGEAAAAGVGEAASGPGQAAAAGIKAADSDGLSLLCRDLQTLQVIAVLPKADQCCKTLTKRQGSILDRQHYTSKECTSYKILPGLSVLISLVL